MMLLLAENNGLILGFIPESIGILIFGVGLIGLAIVMRWSLTFFEADVYADKESVKNFLDKGEPLGDIIEGDLVDQNVTAREV